MVLSISGRKNRITFTLLIILCIMLASLNSKYEQILPMGKSILLEIVSPLQRIITLLINPFIKSIKAINKLSNLLEENRLLTDKVMLLSKEETKLKELERENRELRQLLGSSYYEQFEVKSATIIGKVDTDWKLSLFINKGSNQGIKINMPVVNQSGLTGKVITTSNNFSEVRLLTDVNSSVAAMVQSSRKTGIIQGTRGSTFEMDLVTKEADIKIGDIIITSGLGGIFPKGILIGRVYDVKNLDYELYKTIKVLPVYNYENLEEVLIITNFTQIDQ